MTAVGPAAPEPVAPEPVAPEPVAPEPVAPEPVAPEPVAPEPAAPPPAVLAYAQQLAVRVAGAKDGCWPRTCSKVADGLAVLARGLGDRAVLERVRDRKSVV